MRGDATLFGANTTTLLKAIELLDETPDVIAEVGASDELATPSVGGVGYFGLDTKKRPMSMLGK